MKSCKITVQDTKIVLFSRQQEDYISLTDIARYKNADDPRFVIQNWIKTRYTVDFLGIWKQIHNSNFNRVEFDTVKNQAGTNAFVLTPKKWINKTNSIGIISKSGRYNSGTFAHKDIAFEFASWISPEFKLYLIKEFQRLKTEEGQRKELGWDAKRVLAKVNYRVHTDAVQTHLIPKGVSAKDVALKYANEADVLNLALFGVTAREWREANPDLKGNMRDHADITQLVCLAGLQSLNAEFIRQGLDQGVRLKRLNEIAVIQMRALVGGSALKKK